MVTKLPPLRIFDADPYDKTIKSVLMRSSTMQFLCEYKEDDTVEEVTKRINNYVCIPHDKIHLVGPANRVYQKDEKFSSYNVNPLTIVNIEFCVRKDTCNVCSKCTCSECSSCKQESSS